MDAVIPLSLGKGWIAALSKQLARRFKKRSGELDRINDLLMGQDPLELLKVYVDPQSQEINPANSEEEDFNVSREPTFEKLNVFFGSRRNTPLPGQNILFILSDAGMGKTSLLTMLKLIHLTSFWPRQFNCELFKLGESTLEDVAKVEEKRKTILLLDSLDEDNTATGRVEERILEILDAVSRFHKVVITCRTQFFPTQDEVRLEKPGKIEIGGYKCYAKYLSFFNDRQVDEFLGKRFVKSILGVKIRDKLKIAEAKRIIVQMGALRCRPMLLAHIDEFMKHEEKLTGDMNEYRVYDTLLDNWLSREEAKCRKPKAELLTACMQVALEMQRRGVRELPLTQLWELTAACKGIGNLELIDIQGRSLLNKNSQGDFRFSHYSIQEFLVAKYIRENPEDRLINDIPLTDFIISMFSHVELKQKPYCVIKALLPIEWREIPAGTFQMGGKEQRETPVHTVKLDSFYMSRTPVTFAQYDLFCDATGREKPEDSGWGRGDRPVINVSWNDAGEMCRWLSGITGMQIQLPTEAQWEYACRAGTTGERYGTLDEIAWYRENSEDKTHPVAQKEPNAWGLYDMLGNVLEWCADYYGDYSLGAVENPVGPEKGELRVLRGGSWFNYGRYVRSAYRCRYVPTGRYDDTGFRFAQVKRAGFSGASGYEWTKAGRDGS